MREDGRILWIVDEMMDERALPTGRPLLATAAAAAGHEVLRVRYRKDDPSWTDAVPPDPDRAVVCVGPHQGVEALVAAKGSRWVPGAFHNVAALSYGSMAERWGGAMLNADHAATTWRDFVQRLALDHPEGVFVRPNAVTKAFAGGIVRPADLALGSEASKRFARIRHDDVVVTAPTKKILGESRFVVADGAVIAASTYRWAGKLDVRSDVPEISRSFADMVAADDWQPDAVYVCDVAVVDAVGGYEARLVEMNPFSTSGLYACDTEAIVRSVSAAASRLFLEAAPDSAAFTCG